MQYNKESANSTKMSTKHGLVVLLVLASTVQSVHRDELEEIQTKIQLKPGFDTILMNPTIDRAYEPSEKNITIGFMTSFREGVGKIISGAIPLAVEFVNK